MLGAFALPLGGIVGPVVAVLAMQLQILLDCSDGEVARWRQRFSPAGIYLDRIGHYAHRGGHPHRDRACAPTAGRLSRPGDVGGWTVLGLLVAVVVLSTRPSPTSSIVARAKTGRPLLEDVAADGGVQGLRLAAVRRAVGYLPFFRAFVAVEALLLALAAAVVDVVRGDLLGTQVLVVVMVPLVVVTAAGHLLGVLTSSRLD